MDEPKPAANGYEWNWDEGAVECEEPVHDASWFDQFEALFYGNSNSNCGVVAVDDDCGVVAAADDCNDDDCNDDDCTAQAEWIHTETTTTENEATPHHIYPAYQGYDQQQPAPSIPYDYEYVDANSQTTDLFNTEQCIHTYNVVNTVEEIHTPEDVLLNQCHLMSIAGEITEYEESYLQQLVLQKDPSAKEALRRYSL